MTLTRQSRLMIGLTALSIPTVEYGGTFVLRLITGRLADINLVGLQSTFFRAGHGHAGVLLLLTLVVQILIDQTRLAEGLRWFVRIGAPTATLLVSGGFFFSVMNETGMPSGLIALIYVGALLMALVLVTLAIGLFRSMKEA